MFQSIIQVHTSGKRMYSITSDVQNALRGNLPATGLVNLFIQHTSASLTIQENADPTARQDLEAFLDRLAPDGETWHRHTLEGADDTTSHMKTVVSGISLNIPVVNGNLGLGTWQGIYLWEHRRCKSRRNIIITVL
jgi:secondary thiamine-phosphate synthase enzyme